MIDKGHLQHKRNLQVIRDRPPKAEEKEWNGENHEAVADTVEHRLPRVLVLVIKTEKRGKTDLAISFFIER